MTRRIKTQKQLADEYLTAMKATIDDRIANDPRVRDPLGIVIDCYNPSKKLLAGLQQEYAPRGWNVRYDFGGHGDIPAVWITANRT